MRKKLSRGDKFEKFRELTFANRRFCHFSRFSCNRKIKCSDTVFLTEKKYQRRTKMGINFRELKTTIFRENKLTFANSPKYNISRHQTFVNLPEFAKIAKVSSALLSSLKVVNCDQAFRRKIYTGVIIRGEIKVATIIQGELTKGELF